MIYDKLCELFFFILSHNIRGYHWGKKKKTLINPTVGKFGSTLSYYIHILEPNNVVAKVVCWKHFANKNDTFKGPARRGEKPQKKYLPNFILA